MNNTEKLIQLIKDNPTLPILPMVDGEVVGSDDYGYWLGSFGRCEIDEYIIDNWYGDGCVRFKSDSYEDDIIEGIAEHEYGDCTIEENWNKAAEYLKANWRRAIIVYIGAPDMEDER